MAHPPDGGPALPAPFSRHLSDLCRENGALEPDRLAVIAGDVRLTYAELDGRVEVAAAGLHGLGIRRGGTVGLLCTNRAEWLAAALGAMRLGARVAAFNTFAKAWDLGYMLGHSETEVLVTVAHFRGRGYLETVAELVPELETGDGWRSESYPCLREVVVIGGEGIPAGCRRFEDLGGKAGPGQGAAPGAHRSAADDAFVVYTSGSSARPKAVPLRHYPAVENGWSIGERMGLTQQDRVWASVPLFWSYGAVNALPATLTHRATLVLQEVFSPGEALDLIEAHGVTVAYTLPNMTNALLDHPEFRPERTRTLRTGLTLGTPEDLRRASGNLGVSEICNIYGSTEVYGNCCVTPADWPLKRKLESQGPPLPGVRLRIVPLGSDAEVGAGETGELHVTGYVTRGYLGGDEEGNAVFGADGWFRTGDLGFLDEEGAFHFVARATEMIKTGGINVAPGEVEEFLRLHPGVREAAVVGVDDPDVGQKVVAFVVAEPGLGEPDLRLWTAERIAGYKVPARIHFLGTLPKTDTGKLLRRALTDLDAEARRP